MTSRTVFAILLATAFVVALGCGGDSTPKPPTTQPENPAPKPPETSPPPKNETPKIAPELDQTKHVIPAEPVRGRIAGVEVTPTVSIMGDELTFRVLKPGKQEIERSVKVKLAPMRLVEEPLQVLGREWKVKLGDALPNTPYVWLDSEGQSRFFDATKYALTLELGQLKDQKVSGKIYLSLKDEPNTVLAGTFVAEYIRSASEWPTAIDAPFIRGEVLVNGMKPTDQVRIAYAGFIGDKIETEELQGAPDPGPLELAAWTHNESGRTRLVFGDGKMRPYRYEHTKLAPGRYLISAAVVGGPAVWKWVDVPANGQLTENFTFDAAKTGGVEVSVPAGVTGKVLVAPAEEAGKPPLSADLFQVISIQVVRQDVGIVGGKALVKNLTPGKYEVRVGELKGNVEILADKTAELMLK